MTFERSMIRIRCWISIKFIIIPTKTYVNRYQNHIAMLYFILNRTFTILQSSSMSDKDSDENEEESVKSHESARYDATAATYLDIAVLRCLFILHWQEEGVYWCLHYIYNRYTSQLIDYERVLYTNHLLFLTTIYHHCLR